MTNDTKGDTMNLLYNSHEQSVVWPEDRTDDQQEIIDEQGLDELPEELNHSSVTDSKFLGIPGETTVFDIHFKPDSLGFATTPSEWLLNAQDCGWEISHAHATHTVYSSRIGFWLGVHIPAIGSLFGDEAMIVRVQLRVGDGR